MHLLPHDAAEEGPSLWALAFWRQTVERAVKTFGGSAVTTFGGSAVPFFELALPWQTSLKIVVGTVLVSVCLSLGSIRVGPKGTPSAVPLDEP